MKHDKLDTGLQKLNRIKIGLSQLFPIKLLTGDGRLEVLAETVLKSASKLALQLSGMSMGDIFRCSLPKAMSIFRSQRIDLFGSCQQ